MDLRGNAQLMGSRGSPVGLGKGVHFRLDAGSTDLKKGAYFLFT